MSEVRQDHRGRLYRVVYFDNRITGQRSSVELPYTPNPNAEPARMIPVPEERKPVQRKLTTTTNSKGEKVSVVHKPKRLMVVRYRKCGQKALATSTFDNADGEHFVQQEVRCLLRSPDCGKTWIPAVGNICDHFFQYHVDEEQSNLKG